VYDFGAGEEWTATRGEGAQLDGVPLDPSLPERRAPDGRLELLGIEQADPRHIAAAGELHEVSRRLRVIGAIAVTLCQVAAARLDGMVSLLNCRAVDAAAAQLIVREAGGRVCFGDLAPEQARLGLDARYPIAAAAGEQGLAIARGALSNQAPRRV
jgi:myo-inositol-1(or 4)-monophosphatase